MTALFAYIDSLPPWVDALAFLTAFLVLEGIYLLMRRGG
jgi:hypothetical protein